MPEQQQLVLALVGWAAFGLAFGAFLAGLFLLVLGHRRIGKLLAIGGAIVMAVPAVALLAFVIVLALFARI